MSERPQEPDSAEPAEIRVGLWAKVRAVLRTLMVAVVSVVAGSIAFAFTPLRKPLPKLYFPIRNAAYRLWTWGLCRCWNLDVRVEGTPPTGSFFLVSNHLSYVDIAVLGRHLHVTFIAKADLASWPVLGLVFSSGDTIFIDRGRKRDLLRVMNEVDRALAEGIGVILFPEGTSSRGDGLLPFKPSLLQIASRHKIPVHWATIEYRIRDEDGLPSHRVCWWGDEEFVPHYRRFVTLPRVEAILRFGDEPVQAGDRKQLASVLREQMLERFVAMD